ncbi:Glycosyltransferase [Ignavibacterium album JCM 16511]|uniref:Glycosyltransferase n=1 Tax=Ignavibacterium album (strain DSM 19864 / JCM 16511 / NBRC 101810 / Mat9-16) TaxID=945713 RepID=I0AJG7_IGNAJ|nr:glycosyltransferase [Ignavibacterium album]AFH49124.1 Glycosyltransferase [Ignavibacterium album JCM 16511]
MRICHVISSIDKNSGGTSTYEQLLLNELAKHNNVFLITIKSLSPLPLKEKIQLYFANRSFPYLKAYSNELKNIFNNVECDIFHGNGLWQYPVHKMTSIAIKKNKPYIISPHGMLEPWALNKSKWKKQLSLYLYQYDDLVKANCIHATSIMETRNIRKLGFINPIAVIPNGINLSEFPVKEHSNSKEIRTILFLSRIHPKKGIELLIEALTKIEKSLRRSWQIEIVGNGDVKYIKELQKLIIRYNFTDEIKILSPKFGKEKIAAYHNADLFVLPTYSENFGMVVVEALACGVPVITTKGAPWEELNTHNAGWWIDIGVEPLVQALTEAMKLSDIERKKMGLNGRKLVEENYSIESVAQKMIQLYEWILYKKDKPEFIYE